MTQEAKQQIKTYLSQAKGDSVLAVSLRLAAMDNGENVEENVSSVKEMIETNTPVMLDILGVDAVRYFKDYQSSTAFAPTESEGVE